MSSTNILTVRRVPGQPLEVQLNGRTINDVLRVDQVKSESAKLVAIVMEVAMLNDTDRPNDYAPVIASPRKKPWWKVW